MQTTEPSICPSVSCSVVSLSFTPLHSFFQLISPLHRISHFSFDLALISLNHLVSQIPALHFFISITEGEVKNYTKYHTAVHFTNEKMGLCRHNVNSVCVCIGRFFLFSYSMFSPCSLLPSRTPPSLYLSSVATWYCRRCGYYSLSTVRRRVCSVFHWLVALLGPCILPPFAGLSGCRFCVPPAEREAPGIQHTHRSLWKLSQSHSDCPAPLCQQI